jgi:predicted amidohydrolase YtcJ
MLPDIAVVRRDIEAWKRMGGEALFVHAIGPGAVLETATLFHRILSDRELAAGLTLGFEHMEACPPWVIAQIAELQNSGARVQVCSQPGFNDDLATYTDRLPEDVLAMINPYAGFKRHGLRWTFGTDGPITGDRTFAAFAQAVNRPGPEAISVVDMLGAAIESPLEVGWPFTAICLDRNVFTRPAELADTEVLATWIRGHKVYDRTLQM